MAKVIAANIIKLPQSLQSLHLVIRKAPAYFKSEDGTSHRPHLMVLFDRTTGTAKHFDLCNGVPGAGQLEDFLFTGLSAGSKRFMLAKFGARVRPESLSVETPELHAQLAPVCAEIDVKCVIDQQPARVNEFMRGLEQAMNTGSGRKGIPSILDGAGVTITAAEELWRTCAAFYRAAPWRRLWNDDLIEACYPETGKPFLICVMGNGGSQFGVALFDDLAHFESMSDDREKHRKTYFGVTLDDAKEISFFDVDTADALGWDRVNAELAPQFILMRKKQLVSPDLNDVLRVCAVLHALPAFVRDHLHKKSDAIPQPASAVFDLPGLHGGAKITLRFPAAGNTYSPDARLEPKSFFNQLNDEARAIFGLYVQFEAALPITLKLTAEARAYMTGEGMPHKQLTDVVINHVEPYDEDDSLSVFADLPDAKGVISAFGFPLDVFGVQPSHPQFDLLTKYAVLRANMQT